MARTMSPDEYQELGRRYYKQKQYEKAVEAFTEGIEAANSQSMSLFDHRAASYDKLAKFSLAVRDGRDMIKLDKQNVKVSKCLHAK
jgi:F-box/TPR repeat protein Pof3